MRESLPNNTKIILTGENKREFTIISTLGFGGSCIVYNAFYLDQLFLKHYVKIKECFPVQGTLETRDSGRIQWQSELDKEIAWDAFRKMFTQHIGFQNHEDFVNTICKVSDVLYEGNNTLYLIMEMENGKPYDQVVPKTVYGILKIILALSKTVASYHEAGFLHLDIKPQNFLVLKGSEDFVKIFDFDSIIPMDGITAGNIEALSFSNEWAAPEVRQGQLYKIRETADVYSIGAVLFYSLFNRRLTVEDRVNNGQYNLSDLEILKTTNPALKRKLQIFLQKTLAASVRRRYQNMEEVIGALNELLQVANPDTVYLCDNIPITTQYFAGRNEELRHMKESLERNRILVISGIGGIGKSELVKQYIHTYRNAYDSISWATCDDNITKTLQAGKNLSVANGEAADASEKIELLKVAVTPDSLIILDSILDFNDCLLFELLGINCKFIITTRQYRPAVSIDVSFMLLDHMDVDTLYKVFRHYYQRNISDEEDRQISEIIKQIHCHTLLVSLIAKQMVASSLKPSEQLLILKESELRLAEKEKFAHLKDNILEEGNIFYHISLVFDTAKLTKKEQLILRIASLIGNYTVNRKQLGKWSMNLEIKDQRPVWDGKEFKLKGVMSLDPVNNLIRKGWLIFDEKADRVSIHDVIAQFIQEKEVITFENCTPFLEQLLWTWVFIRREEFVEDGSDVHFVGDVFNEHMVDLYADLTLSVLENLDFSDTSNAQFFLMIGQEMQWKRAKEISDMAVLLYDNSIFPEYKIIEKFYLYYLMTGGDFAKFDYYYADKEKQREFGKERSKAALISFSRAIEYIADFENEIERSLGIMDLLRLPIRILKNYGAYPLYDNEEGRRLLKYLTNIGKKFEQDPDKMVSDTAKDLLKELAGAEESQKQWEEYKKIDHDEIIKNIAAERQSEGAPCAYLPYTEAEEEYENLLKLHKGNHIILRELVDKIIENEDIVIPNKIDFIISAADKQFYDLFEYVENDQEIDFDIAYNYYLYSRLLHLLMQGHFTSSYGKYNDCLISLIILSILSKYVNGIEYYSFFYLYIIRTEYERYRNRNTVSKIMGDYINRIINDVIRISIALERNGYILYAFRLTSQVEELIFSDKKEYLFHAIDDPGYIYEYLIHLSQELKDKYHYYKYLRKEEEVTGVAISGKEELDFGKHVPENMYAAINEKCGELFSLDNLAEREELCNSIKREGLFPNDVIKTFQELIYLGCSLKDYHLSNRTNFKCMFFNPVLYSSVEKRFNKTSIENAEYGLLLCELIFQSIIGYKTKEARNYIENFKIFISSRQLLCVDIMDYSMLPKNLIRKGYFEEAFELYQELEKSFYRDYHLYSYYTLTFTEKYIDIMYDVLIEGLEENLELEQRYLFPYHDHYEQYKQYKERVVNAFDKERKWDENHEAWRRWLARKMGLSAEDFI